MRSTGLIYCTLYSVPANATYIHVNPERQTAARRAKRGGVWKGGVQGSSPINFQKPVLQMVQSELFLSYICQYN